MRDLIDVKASLKLNERGRKAFSARGKNITICSLGCILKFAVVAAISILVSTIFDPNSGFESQNETLLKFRYCVTTCHQKSYGLFFVQA